ncbi:MAG: NMD3-related protein [Candidatus Aenigmatarchaeota archaeon]
MKFCFVCGKKTNELVDGYCEDCYNDKFSLLKVPKELTVKMCTRCNMIKHRNRWMDIKVEDVLRDKIEVLGRAVDLKIDIDDNITIKAKGFLKDCKKSKKESYDIRLKINKIVCPTCSRASGGYYEAIIQLRGKTEEAMDFLVDQAVKEQKNYRAEQKGRCFDVYIMDKHFANSVANAMIKRFKARIKKSFRIVTKKEGKDIYRSVIVVRI